MQQIRMVRKHPGCPGRQKVTRQEKVVHDGSQILMVLAAGGKIRKEMFGFLLGPVVPPTAGLTGTFKNQEVAMRMYIPEATRDD